MLAFKHDLWPHTPSFDLQQLLLPAVPFQSSPSQKRTFYRLPQISSYSAEAEKFNTKMNPRKLHVPRNIQPRSVL